MSLLGEDERHDSAGNDTQRELDGTNDTQPGEKPGRRRKAA